MRGIRRFIVSICVAGSVLCLAPGALAAGGASIAAAPTVVYGQLEFGNTVTDSGKGTPQCDNAGDGRSWWLLPVLTGDQVKIDLAGHTEGDGFIVAAYSVGTNDFNFVNEPSPYASNSEHQADQAEVVFRAPADGNMPLLVSSCDNVGDYSFTAYVTHGVVAKLSSKGSNHRQHRTYFAVSAYNPDGAPVTSGLHATVQVSRSGKWGLWKTLSQSQFSSFYIGWPRSMRGHSWNVRVVVSGSGYQTATSRAQRVQGV
jgi:hypothetical protein